MLTINHPPLTSEQLDLIPIYRHKWQQVALNREKIDREQATLAINKAYSFLNRSEPNIIFFPTPYDALLYIHREITDNWGKLANTTLKSPIASNLANQLIGNIRKDIREDIKEKLQGNLDNNLANNIAKEIAEEFECNTLFSLIWANAGDLMFTTSKNSDADDFTKAMFELFFEAGFIFNNYISIPLWQMQKQLDKFFAKNNATQDNINQMYSMVFTGKLDNTNKYELPYADITCSFTNTFIPSVMTDFAYYINFYHQVLNCPLERDKWNIFNDLITSCGWIFPYEKTVLICDR